MATLADVKHLNEEEQLNYKAKVGEFAAKGKKPFEVKEHGPGVITDQDYFDSLRDPSDPDYKSPKEPIKDQIDA